MFKSIVLSLGICLFSCASPKTGNPQVEIRTTYGNIQIELYAAQAPKTVAAFLANIDSGFYQKAAFYRVLTRSNQPSDHYKAELIQGGTYLKRDKRVKAMPGIPHESTEQTKIQHKDGVISLARMEPGSARSEFFICIGDQPGFDYGGENNPDKQGYAAFGKVVRGMEVVDKIYNAPEHDQSLRPPVPIINIVEL